MASKPTDHRQQIHDSECPCEDCRAAWGRSQSTHGSPELDEDARKLKALGADPGPTFDALLDAAVRLPRPPLERARSVVQNVRDEEIFSLPSDERWERAIESAIKSAMDAERERCASIALDILGEEGWLGASRRRIEEEIGGLGPDPEDCK